MNIKQSFSNINEVLTTKIGHFRGYCPTSKEIKNEKVESLAKKLKADSNKETLSNILEWQERNLEFWTERHPILTLVKYVWLIFAATVVVFYEGFVYGSILLIVLNSHIAGLVSFVQITVWFMQNIGWFIAIFVGSTLTIFAAMISILHSNRKFPWKEIPRGLKNVIWFSISIDFLLDKRLGVCRDYAKTTACLLSNIYPNKEVYFASAPDHVATGIYIDNRLYMLDQRLPILTIDRWNEYRKPQKSDWIKRFDPVKNALQKVDKSAFLQTKDKTELNTENLAKKMTKLLNVEEQSDEKAIPLQRLISIPWKNGANLYEEDEMTDYSLARWLAMKILSELVRIDQITGISIEADDNKKGLTFQIHVRKDK